MNSTLWQRNFVSNRTNVAVLKQNLYIFGHPEAVTFPHNYPHLQESINLAHGGEIDSWLLKAILGLVNWGLVSRTRAAALLTVRSASGRCRRTQRAAGQPPRVMEPGRRLQ